MKFAKYAILNIARLLEIQSENRLGLTYSLALYHTSRYMSSVVSLLPVLAIAESLTTIVAQRWSVLLKFISSIRQP